MDKSKYYFYNKDTGCDWEEEMTFEQLDRFLQRRTWIKQGKEAKDLKEQADIKRNCNG